MDAEHVMIVVGVPADALDAVLGALAEAGAGEVGAYTHCAYTSEGVGRFRPAAGANPAVGAREAVNAVPEVRVETFCRRTRARAVVAALRAAHPYEEPVIYVVPLLDPAAL